MDKIINSSLQLLEQAIKEYTNKFTVWRIKDVHNIYGIVYSYNITYLSEWLHKTGFDKLNTIKDSKVERTNEIQSGFELQMHALRLNTDTDSKEHYFASITSYVDSLYQIISESSKAPLSLQEFYEVHAEELMEKYCDCNTFSLAFPPCCFCSGEENDKIEKAYEEYLLNEGEYS